MNNLVPTHLKRDGWKEGIEGGTAGKRGFYDAHTTSIARNRLRMIGGVIFVIIIL